MSSPKQTSSDERLPPGDPRGLANTTNIDRRQCRREVPLKILALGLSRSGTCSLRQALLDLGYKDCYHFASILNENPRDADMWIEALEAKFEGKGKPFERKDWDQLLGHCQAITDTPCAVFYRELLAAYPDAKVILTERDSSEQWHQSQMKTLVPFFEYVIRPDDLQTRVWRFFGPRQQAQIIRMDKLLLKHYMYADMERNGKQFYESYSAEIKRIVPPERLLVFNVKQGWKPLCDFLEVSTPEVLFPHVNESKIFEANAHESERVVNSIVIANMVKAGTCVVAGAVAVYFLFKRRAT